jgi:hypothetical protein
VVVALVSLLLAAGLVAPAVAGADGDTGAAARNLTLDDLAPGGEKPANAPPSVRQNGKYGEFVVKYLPTGLLVQEGEKSPSWRYMEQRTSIKRNYLQLWSKRPYGADTEQYKVRIAHWQRGQETIETEDGETRTEPAAVNVTTYTRTVSFSGGYDYAEISLTAHYDQPVRTTMCVQEPGEPNCLENPTETRWQFTHHSSHATAPIKTDSEGARLAWGYGILVLPFFLTSLTTLYVGNAFVERAKAGPQISVIWWVIAGVLLALFVLIGWDWINETLIRAPWLVTAVAGVLLGLIAVEWFGRRTYGVGFLQFRLADGFDPTDPQEVQDALEANSEPEGGETDPTEAPGVLKARFYVQKFARGEDNERTAIRKGIRKFWARARGATADLEVDGNMQTSIDVDGPIEELYLLDPEDDEPLAYEPEHHEIGLPNLLEYEDGDLVGVHPAPYLLGIGALGLSWLAGQVLTGSGVLGLLVGGLLVFAVGVARPTAGRLFANLAPVHYHHAVSAMLTHAQGLGEARAWEDWFRQYAESEADKKADKKALTDDRSKSQMERLFDRYVGDTDADAPTRSGGSADD